jgi:hypothetical protein
VNADGLSVQPKVPAAPKPNKVSRLIEPYEYILEPEEIAALRVALVALIKTEKRIAWNEGAECVDNEWWSSEYANGLNDNRYWGYVESTKNPYRD